MSITDINEVPGSKSRFRIYIDEEFAFVLYKGELLKYGITVNSELSDETYLEICEKVLPKRAKRRSLNILTNRCCTEYQLREKLHQGEYSNEIIEKTIEYLKSYNYINDSQFTRDYISYHLNNKSRKLIRRDLFKKGIPFEVTDAIYVELIGEDEEALEKTQISRWLEKKKFDKKCANLKEKQQLFSFLQRKGFSPDAILRFL